MKRYGSKSRSCCLKLDAVTLPVFRKLAISLKALAEGSSSSKAAAAAAAVPPPHRRPSLHLCLNVCVCISPQQRRSFHISHSHPEVCAKQTGICGWRSLKLILLKNSRGFFNFFDLFCFGLNPLIKWSAAGVPSVYPEINRSGWRHRAEWELLSHRETFHKKLPVQTLWHRTKNRPCRLKLGTVPLPFFWGGERKLKTHTNTIHSLLLLSVSSFSTDTQVHYKKSFAGGGGKKTYFSPQHTLSLLQNERKWL